jgi:hypothetical protein
MSDRKQDVAPLDGRTGPRGVQKVAPGIFYMPPTTEDHAEALPSSKSSANMNDAG